MKPELIKYLERIEKLELRYMFEDIDDPAFGVETDRYKWCKKVLEDESELEWMLIYFKAHYADSEREFINRICQLM